MQTVYGASNAALPRTHQSNRDQIDDVPALPIVAKKRPESPEVVEVRQNPKKQAHAKNIQIQSKKRHVNFSKLKQKLERVSSSESERPTASKTHEKEMIKELVNYAKQHGHYPQHSQFYSKVIQDELDWQS